MTAAIVYPPIISSDSAWAYTRARGWQPRPGTHPKRGKEIDAMLATRAAALSEPDEKTEGETS